MTRPMAKVKECQDDALARFIRYFVFTICVCEGGLIGDLSFLPSTANIIYLLQK